MFNFECKQQKIGALEYTNMHYEHFSRHLREKYATNFHLADHIVDQLKDDNQSQRLSTAMYKLNRKNMIKAQREISYPLISYLNKFACDKQISNEYDKEFEPYFNECLLAAERVKNNRRSDRDRQICYENFLLTQKLQRIKNQSRPNARMNLEKTDENHCRFVKREANCRRNATYNEERPCRSSFRIENNKEPSLSEDDDDQATAADVDASMNTYDSHSLVLCKQRNLGQNNGCFDDVQSIVTKCKGTSPMNSENQSCFGTENVRIYQHLSNIDTTLIRDTIGLPTSSYSRHFSICIPLHFDSDIVESKNNHSESLSCNRQYALRKEILHY